MSFTYMVLHLMNIMKGTCDFIIYSS
jgi:hypothetical protein